MACARVIDRYPGRRLQAGAQNVARFVEEVILFVGQQPLDLSLGDRHANRMQQRRQTRQRGLPLMILHQHETAQVGAKMSARPLRERCNDGPPIRCNPAFTQVAGRVHRQHKFLHQIRLVALEA
jgi:hypothetical protein